MDTKYKYGYTLNEWNKARAEIRNILIKKAKNRAMITYSDLVSQVRTISLEPDSYALATMLGEISSNEASAGRGMLTVLVVHKYGDMQPGPGFFDLAEELGRDTTDIEKCWINELKKVFEYWSNP